MTPFDLVFIAVFLATVAALGAVAVAVLRGRRHHAVRRLKVLAIGLAGYLTVVTGVSLLSSRGVVALGEDQCSDDWCIAVTSITLAATTADDVYEVVFRISSRARRVPQRERFVISYMLDSTGRRHDADQSQDQPPFDRRLSPGEAVLTARTFRVPGGGIGLGVVVAREGDSGFPRCCILGQGLFHKPPIVFAL